MFDETTTKLELSNTQKTDHQSNVVKVDFAQKVKKEEKAKTPRTRSNLFPSLREFSPWVVQLAIFLMIVGLSLLFL